MPTTGAATNTATVVTIQRKTKCLIGKSYADFWFDQTRARNCLRIVGCAVNEMKSSTPSICAEKDQNCPKQKSNVSRNCRIDRRSEAQQIVSRAASTDESKKRRTSSQEKSVFAKSKSHDASRGANNSGA